ncbi:pyridoxamine 5'-phosphate oxidase family protein [Flaviaesturariibacter amylovorans]|uniref:General stress protein FMN-binding split barrel domain-containing protein n=1 Tax=Flaviaesturariibacter amylovorans TaxID=1084520 RepID=A0ABP8GK71_9BACT
MEKHLQNEEAQAKLKKLVEEIRVCMFITNADDAVDHTRPMSVVDVDPDGKLWFFTDIRSIKVEEVEKTHKVHLTFAHPGKESYLDLWGSSHVVTDRAKIKEKFTPMVKPWFPNGPEDPNIALLHVHPERCYYWDAETGKMVQFLKMAVGAVTGNSKIADSTEGKLSL